MTLLKDQLEILSMSQDTKLRVGSIRFIFYQQWDSVLAIHDYHKKVTLVVIHPEIKEQMVYFLRSSL